MIIWYISGTSRLSRLRTNPPARNPNPPFGSTAVCGSYPQTRPVWDCHRTADQARGGGLRGQWGGSPSWQSHGASGRYTWCSLHFHVTWSVHGRGFD